MEDKLKEAFNIARDINEQIPSGHGTFIADDFDPEYRPLVINALKKHFFFREELKDHFLRKPNTEQ